MARGNWQVAIRFAGLAVVFTLLLALVAACASAPATPTPTPAKAAPAPAKATSAPASEKATPAAAKEKAAPAQAQFKLTLASWEPPDGATPKVLRPWAQELEDKSNGRVKVEIAYGSVMGPAPEHYDLAVKGVADIGHAGLPYTPGRFPMAEITDLPIADASEEIYSKAYWELYKKGYFDNDFKDTKVLFMGVVGPYDYQMASKQVKTFADMAGKKMRAAGRVHTQLIQALGSVPVGMAAPEIYTAMERGVLDGTFAPWSFMKAMRTDPVTKYVTSVRLGGFTHGVYMNKASYEKLPADIRKIIDDMSDKYGSQLMGQNYASETRDARDNLFKGQLLDLSAADKQKVADAIAPVWKSWIAEGEQKGLPRKKMADEYYNLLKGLGVQQPFVGYTP
ncbi:MAG: TRAP transporter substrate-binding protein [Chloroflexi bacterium]|nr:TRAP transporter substrate-binding protein [Chloroflexota bacterium]